MTYVLENLGLKYAFIGCGVAVLCLIIPLVHFVSGPLSPLIGGWVAGNMAKAEAGKAVRIGALMGAMLAVPILVLPTVLGMLMPWLELPRVTEGGLILFLFAGFLAISVVLAMAGAAVGGNMARKSPS